MATQYRMTVGWNQSVMGVSETWYSPPDTVQTFVARAQRWLEARANAMYDNQYFFGVRISQWGSLRRSQLTVPPGGNVAGPNTFLSVPVNGNLASSSASMPPDHLRSVLQYRLTF